MSKAATSTKRKSRGYQYLGTTSDGVRIIKPMHGKRNLTEAQIRRIVDGLLERTGRQPRKPVAAE